MEGCYDKPIKDPQNEVFIKNFAKMDNWPPTFTIYYLPSLLFIMIHSQCGRKDPSPSYLSSHLKLLPIFLVCPPFPHGVSIIFPTYRSLIPILKSPCLCSVFSQMESMSIISLAFQTFFLIFPSTLNFTSMKLARLLP